MLFPPLHLGVVANEKGAFGSPSTTVANLYDCTGKILPLRSLCYETVLLKYNFKKKEVPYLPTPLLGQDMTHGQFLSGV